MITGDHTVIRASESDDAESLWALYDPKRPRAFLLGPTQEILIPTVEELRTLLSRREAIQQGAFYIVEDLTGAVVGCIVLRAAMGDSPYAELVVALASEDAYATPVGDEIIAFVQRQAFTVKRRNKITTHCLGTEKAYRTYLVSHGFTSDGLQEQIIYTQGRYHDMETLTLFPETNGAE